MWETLLDRRSSCIARAQAAAALLEGGERRGAFFERAGLSRTRLAHLVKLLTLPAAVIAFLEKGALSQGHGELLAALPATRAEELARSAIAHGWSVRELERRVKGKAGANDADTAWLQRLIEDHFACPVELVYDGQKAAGALTLRFSSLDELDGLLAKCGVRVEQ